VLVPLASWYGAFAFSTCLPFTLTRWAHPPLPYLRQKMLIERCLMWILRRALCPVPCRSVRSLLANCRMYLRPCDKTLDGVTRLEVYVSSRNVELCSRRFRALLKFPPSAFLLDHFPPHLCCSNSLYNLPSLLKNKEGASLYSTLIQLKSRIDIGGATRTPPFRVCSPLSSLNLFVVCLTLLSILRRCILDDYRLSWAVF